MNLDLWKQVKKEKKLTLQDISDLSNIPKRTVDDIFSGKTTNPRTDTAQAIEKALGISEEQPTYNVSPKKKEIIDLMMQVDDETLNDIMTVVKLMIKK